MLNFNSARSLQFLLQVYRAPGTVLAYLFITLSHETGTLMYIRIIQSDFAVQRRSRNISTQTQSIKITFHPTKYVVSVCSFCSDYSTNLEKCPRNFFALHYTHHSGIILVGTEPHAEIGNRARDGAHFAIGNQRRFFQWETCATSQTLSFSSVIQ